MTSLPWPVRLAGNAAFHARAQSIEGLRHIARAEGRAIFDMMQGFVRSQVLLALVQGGVLARLSEAPASLPDLSVLLRMANDRALILMRAGAGLRLVRQRADRWTLTTRGAAFLAVPGLSGMVAHHGAFYQDLADPLALLRSDGPTALSRFWPYVFDTEGDPAQAREYSRLMADSQGLVADEVLRMVDLAGVHHLLDVGGGTGAFLRAVHAARPEARLTLFDLPAVVAGATGPFATVAGSFRDDPLPVGANTVSLIRVLYDHQDATVADLLSKVHAALPPGGRLIVAEPMAGDAAPDPQTDVYFALYTLAMRTGRTRRPSEIAALLTAAGFSRIRAIQGFRPFVTGVVEATRT